MRCHCLGPRVFPAGSEPVRPENPDPEDPGGAGGAPDSEVPGGAGGAHDPMRDDAVDGEEAMVPRVPSLPPEPSARQIAEHELTGVDRLTEPLPGRKIREWSEHVGQRWLQQS